MEINITTTTEFLQELETLLSDYERALDNHLYAIWYESSIREAQARIATIRAEMNRMIGQAERQITQPDHSGVYE